jgi:hypothetical protein
MNKTHLKKLESINKFSIIVNNKGDVNYAELTKKANKILNGTYIINKISLAEEQGRRKGGRTNVEASLILNGDKKTNSRRYENKPKQEIIFIQEDLLRKYAAKKGLWIDEKQTADNALAQLPSGFESHVYLNKDGTIVIKFVNYRTLDNTPESFLDNRISLFNYIVGDSNTHYTLKGFWENAETEQFKFVIAQSFVHGKNVDFNNHDELCAFDNEMLKRGLKKFTDGVYISKDYALFDIKNGNVKIDKYGNYHFIDIVSTLNGRQTGGKRKYGNGNIKYATININAPNKYQTK